MAPILEYVGDRSVEWGEELTFTVTANDPGNDELTYSLEGTIPAGALINDETGEFSWTSTSDQIGSYTFNVKVSDDGDPVLSDDETITVTVGKRSTTLVYTGDLVGQYSDKVTFAATLIDELSGGTLEGYEISFKLGSKFVSNILDNSGLAKADLVLDQVAGSYQIESFFAGNSLFLESGDSDDFTINVENAFPEYTGDTIISTGKPINLRATIYEALDGYPGDLTKIYVTFQINGVSYGPVIVSNTDSLGVCVAEMQISDLLEGGYEILVKIEPNDYYTCLLYTSPSPRDRS